MTKNRISRLEQDLEREQAKSRLFMELTKHVGRARAIGMGELHDKVFEKNWVNRINDTKRLRQMITNLRWGKDGPPQPIASVCCTWQPGYYIATGNELEEYIKRIEKKHLKGLALAARLRKLPLPELLGQMVLRMQEPGAGEKTHGA